MSRGASREVSGGAARRPRAAPRWPLLALDAGNSAVKGAVFRPGPARASSIIRVAAARGASKAAVARDLRAALRALEPKPAAVLVASVRPDLGPAISRAVAAALGLEARFAATDVAIPLDLRVRRPRMVGADRLVDALGALAAVDGAPGAIVLDCGSAITCDAVTARGAFLGGAIAPGAPLAARALRDFTAQLPLVAIDGRSASARATGRDTREAIDVGLRVGLRGLAAALVENARRALPPGARVVATGGDARLLAPRDATIVPDLALRGVALLHALAGARPRRRRRPRSR